MKTYTVRPLCAALLLATATNAHAHGGDTTLIHSCVNNKTKAVIIVGATSNCAAGNTALDWAIQGPPGPTDPVLLGRISTLESQVTTLQQQVAGILGTLAQPNIIVSDVTLNEGTASDTSTTSFTFTVSLSMPSSATIVANYATIAGTADTTDFGPIAGQLVFLPGQTSTTVTVPVKRDANPELNETFQLALTGVVNALPTKPSGKGTIVNDDRPSISISGTASALEGQTFVYNISLSGPVPTSVSVDYSLMSGTATVGTDVSNVSGTLVFAPGQTVAQVSVQSNDDLLVEGGETFAINLSNPVNAVFTNTQVSSKIVDNDVTLSIVDTNVTEGNTGTSPITTMPMHVTLSAPVPTAVTVTYGQTVGGTATTLNFQGTAGDMRITSQFITCDIDSPTLSSGCPTLTFNPGETDKVIIILVLGDTTAEPNENFFVKVIGDPGVVVSKNIAEGIIVNDD